MTPLATSLCAALQAIAISGGTIHPMDGARPYQGCVVITEGVISACGADVQVPEGAQVIDAEGLHVVPGLIDGMMHHDGDHDDLYVRAGVLLGRDMGNDLGRIFFSRARRARAGARGPRLFVSGAVLDGVPPITTKAVIVRSPEEAKQKLERLLGLDVDFVATHMGVREALGGVVEAAHAGGVQVWGPIPRGVTLTQAGAIGLDGVVGLDGFLEDVFGWVAPETPDFSAGVKVAQAEGLKVMPVLNSVGARLRIPRDAEHTLGQLGPHYVAQWRAELNAREERGGPEYYERGARALGRQEALLATLYGARVTLVPGSGAPNPWIVPGDGLHDELDAWVRAGIHPREVLRMATSGAAEALGLGELHGKVAEGAFGDLLVVEGDPRESLSVLKRPRWVILRGEALSAEVLESRVAELRERQAEARLAAVSELIVEPPELPDGELLLSGLVRSEAFGQRIGLERYAVVRLPEDGGLRYCSRLVVPASATEGSSSIEFQQTIKARTVSSFELSVTSQGALLEVRGQRVGGQFRVERRVDGHFFDNNSTSDRVSLVDTGSITACLVLAHHLKPGTHKALYFEEFEPVVADWALEVRESGIRSVQTGEGPMAALFREDGGFDKMERTRGNGVVRHLALETDTHGGSGVPLVIVEREAVAEQGEPAQDER